VSVQNEVQRVAIISIVPVRCGNTASIKDISTSTAGWKTDATGEILEGPRGGSHEMAFDIGCDTKNGPIYIEVTVLSPRGGQLKSLIVGPMPGPVDPN
jgi:hypothetical protein